MHATGCAASEALQQLARLGGRREHYNARVGRLDSHALVAASDTLMAGTAAVVSR
jgi:hypothetical protein